MGGKRSKDEGGGGGGEDDEVQMRRKRGRSEQLNGQVRKDKLSKYYKVAINTRARALF